MTNEIKSYSLYLGYLCNGYNYVKVNIQLLNWVKLAVQIGGEAGGER